MRTGPPRVLSLIAVFALLSSCTTAPPRDAERNDDGLEPVEYSRLDELNVAPGVQLANYRRVMLDPIEVSFKERWRRDHPEVTDQDAQRIQTDLANQLHEILVEELARGGYVLAEAPEKDVLRVRASLVEVDVVAPEGGEDVGVRRFVRSAGEMTLRAELFDAPSGALIARARDHTRDPERRVLEPANRVTNNVAARRAFEQWAEEMRSVLDVAKVRAGARTPAN